VPQVRVRPLDANLGFGLTPNSAEVFLTSADLQKRRVNPEGERVSLKLVFCSVLLAPGWSVLLPLSLLLLAQQIWIFVSARRSANREELFKIITENAADMIALVNVKGRRLYNSPSYQKVLGYTAAELARTPVFEQIHPDDRAKVLEASRQARETGVGQTLQYRLRHKEGSWRILESTASTIRNAKGQVEKLVIVNRDITARKAAEERLAHDALHDTLTGLPNRRVFLERLQHCFAQSRRDDSLRYAALLIDIDHFKDWNTDFGPAAADRVLIDIARRLEVSMRDDGSPALNESLLTDRLLCRFSGDEFAILLEGVRDPSDAMRVANSLQSALSLPFHVDGHAPRSAGISIGIALSDATLDRPDDLLNDAETAMRRAQSLGGNRSELFDTTMHTLAVSRLQLEAELRAALNQHQLRVFYQPIVSLDTRAIVGFEGLVRWQHPVHGLISPARFIDAAEDIGLISAIDQWVILEACRQICSWQSLSPAFGALRIAANISARHFAIPSLTDHIRAVLRETQIDPLALQLEITDRIASADPATTSAVLSQLKQLRVSTAIDDYGTGAFSLSQLRRAPVDLLKIDRFLIRNMLSDIASRNVVELLLTLGRQWKINVLAQGIEKASQCEALKEFGCLLGQGYLFSPPVSADAAAQLLRNQCAPNPVFARTH
jgi:diguanylate cyclase (GGDEF)-like protein/PAS domain S-box-containing protein